MCMFVQALDILNGRMQEYHQEVQSSHRVTMLRVRVLFCGSLHSGCQCMLGQRGGKPSIYVRQELGWTIKSTQRGRHD